MTLFSQTQFLTSQLRFFGGQAQVEVISSKHQPDVDAILTAHLEGEQNPPKNASATIFIASGSRSASSITSSKGSVESYEDYGL